MEQWITVVLLPVTTFVFIFAGVQAHRTHGCTFDSIVLYLCAFFNLFYMFEDFIDCSESGQFLKITYVTGMILYLFANFEEMLKNMELENDRMRNRINRSATLSNTNTSLVNTTAV